jgi:nucleoside-diphosphate-sugar epimerase
VRDSLADIGAAADAFGFHPSVALEDGLRVYLDWLGNDPVTQRRWSSQ